ncbi:MAG: hypothetical protein ACRD1K_15495 [Acidimicrobiales bacterium]
MTTPPVSDPPSPPGPPDRRPRALVLTAAVLVVVLGVVATIAVTERRDRRALEDRVARLESEKAATGPSATADDGGADGGGGGDGDANPLAALLDSLGGGGDLGGALGGLAGGDLLGECGEAFAAALGGGGLAGLFGGGAAGEEGGDDPGRQVAAIIEAVEELRGLRFTTRPSPVFLSPEQLQARVRRNVDAELSAEAAAADTSALIALGALPPGSDLKALTLQALSDQVAGFYDTRTGELVVGEPDGRGRLSAQARIVLAHELDHALADQALGLPVQDGRPPPGTEDSALARLTLVEGDATLLMQLYGLAHVPLTEQLSGIAVALEAQEDLARLPPFLQRQLTFPYFQGLNFACRLQGQGGWPTVDAAYRDAPTTSAQVLFPERFAAKEAAVDAPDPASPGAGWTPSLSQAFGAAPLLWLLEAPGGEVDRALDDPLAAAGDWAGGELRAWSRGDRTAVGLSLVPRPGRAEALCATMAGWYRAAFPADRTVGVGTGEKLAVDGSGQDAVVRCRTGGESPVVLVGIGPDLATARAVAASAG